MKPSPRIYAHKAAAWLSEQRLVYASRYSTGGVMLRLEYWPSYVKWAVVSSVSNVLYEGQDLAQAVKKYNEV